MENEYAGTEDFSQITAEDIQVGTDNSGGYEANPSLEDQLQTQESEQGKDQTDSEGSPSQESAETPGQSESEQKEGEKSDETPTSTEEASQQQEAVVEDEAFSDDEVNHIVNQLTGHDNVGDLIGELEHLRGLQETTPDAKNHEGLSDYTRNLIEYEQKGGDPKAYAKVHSLDVEGMSSKEALKQKFINDNSDSSREDAERFFELHYRKKYGFDEDIDSDDDVEFKKQQEAFDARAAKADLNKQKESLMTLEPQDGKQAELKASQAKESQEQSEQEQQQQEAEQQKQYEADQKYFEQHTNSVNELSQDFGGFDLSFGDDAKNNLNYQVSDEVATQVKDWLSTPYVDPSTDNFQNTILNHIFVNDQDNSKLDLEKAQFIATIVADPQGYKDAIFNHGIAKGKEMMVTGKVNPSRRETFTSSSGGGEASEMSQVADAFANLRNR